MATKGLDAGKAFFAGILGKITDPEQKAAAEKLMANETFLTEVGSGVAGQSEIDRQLQALRTQKEELDTRATEIEQRTAGLEDWHGRLTEWHKENKAAIDDAKKLRAGGKTGTGEEGKEKVTAGLTEEQFGERLTNERAAFLGYSRDQQAITRDFFTKFHEIVDLDPLLTHPQVGTIGLKGVYELVHKDRLAKFAEDTKTKAEEAIRADERAKVMAANAQLPYPIPTGAGSGSPLDALAVGKPDSVADAASAHYARILAERNAGAAGGAS